MTRPPTAHVVSVPSNHADWLRDTIDPPPSPWRVITFHTRTSPMTELPDPAVVVYTVRTRDMASVSPPKVITAHQLHEMISTYDASRLPTIDVETPSGWRRVKTWEDVVAATGLRVTPPVQPSPGELLAVLHERNSRLARCLGFFASVIKSGEPWTPTCQAMYDEARSLEPLQSEAWSPFLKPVHDAVDALNLALVAAGRAGLTMEVFNGQFSSGPDPVVPHVTAVASRLCPRTPPSR